jgi:hypothetical protein
MAAAPPPAAVEDPANGTASAPLATNFPPPAILADRPDQGDAPDTGATRATDGPIQAQDLIVEAEAKKRARPLSQHARARLRAEAAASFLEAAQLYERALTADPSDSHVAGELGDVCQIFSRPSDAEAWCGCHPYAAPSGAQAVLTPQGCAVRYRRALELRPHDVPSLRGLAALLRRQKPEQGSEEASRLEAAATAEEEAEERAEAAADQRDVDALLRDKTVKITATQVVEPNGPETSCIGGWES